MQQLQFGDITVDRVVEAEGLGFPPEFLLPDSDMAAIRACDPWILPQFFDPESGRFIQSVHAYVIRTPRHTILIDTCVGNQKDRPSTRGWHRMDTAFLSDLARLGVTPADVDFVMCTHLHVDHVGWNTQLVDGRWVPTFPNARYLFHRTEIEHWETHGDYVPEGGASSDGFYEDSVLPVFEANQAELIDSDFDLDHLIHIEPTPGHSPGHICIHLAAATADGRKEAVFAGDLLHHPVQCAHPEWNSRFCWDADMSAATRKRFVERHAERDVLVLPAHFAAPTWGRIEDGGKGAGGRGKFTAGPA